MTSPHSFNLKLAFIGGGNMAQAIINGLLASGFDPRDIIVSDPVDAVREKLSLLGLNTTVDNEEVLQFTDTSDGLVVLAIKPQLFDVVLSPLAGKFNEQLVLSIAAGVTVSTIQDLIHHNKVVRAMPNTPALVMQGASGLFAPHNVSDLEKATCEVVLSATGIVVWVDTEDKLHAVTAVSGSAPAYFFLFMESMIKAGQELGLSYEQAHDLTLQTAFGSSKLAIESADSPEILRKKVTSPNGTTHEAIESFKAQNIEKIVATAMAACSDRSIEMSKK